MLRITHTRHTDGSAFVLEGRLCQQWVQELRDVLARELTQVPGGRITLIVTDVVFIDADGAILLREAGAWGVHLIGASPFLSSMVSGGVE